MQGRPDENELITLDEARQYLKVSRNKLSNLIDSGKLQTFTTILDKRKKLVRRSDVERLKNS